MSISKLLKSIAFLVVLISVLLVGGVYWLAASDRAIDYDVITDGINIPTFDEITIDFIPTYDKMQTLPFTAGAIIDIDNDGIEEVFFGGGIHQPSVCLYENEEVPRRARRLTRSKTVGSPADENSFHGSRIATGVGTDRGRTGSDAGWNVGGTDGRQELHPARLSFFGTRQLRPSAC